MNITKNCIVCRKKFKDITTLNFFLTKEDLFQWKPIKIKICDNCLNIICKDWIKNMKNNL